MSSLSDLRLFAGVFVALALTLASHAAPPVVTNVHASQAGANHPVKIYYDLQDADSATVRVSLLVSEDGGGTWNVPAQSLSGFGFGAGVTPGSARYILWNAPADWPGRQSSLVRFRVVVNDDPIPAGMALIPAGNFQMGDPRTPTEGEGEKPVHAVYLSGFYIDRTDVTTALWDDVRAWGLTHGYTYLPEGSVSSGINYSKGPTHPVYYVGWYDAVAWCNARSEKEGLVPVYDPQATATNAWVKWGANGYRLPTEAEWEKAARGGASGHRFPWSNVETIDHSQANYYSRWQNGSHYYNYDISPYTNYHPAYAVNGAPYTSPVGSFAANGYGLYDMAGNLQEFCWDKYDWLYYENSPSADPQGPPGNPANSTTVVRDGSWVHFATACRASYRYPWVGYPNNYTGFRTVRR